MVTENFAEGFVERKRSPDFLVPALIIIDCIILISIAFLPPEAVIAVFLVFLLSIFFLISPLGYVYFIIIWMPYEGLILPEGGPVRVLRLITIFLLLALAWTKFALSSKKFSLPPRTIFLPLAMFFVWAGITVFFSPAPMNSLFIYVKMMGFFLIFLTIYNMVDSKDDLRRVFQFYVISSLPIFAVALYEFFIKHNLRTGSILGNPNTLGIYSLTLSVVIVISYFLSKRMIFHKTIYGILYIFAFLTLVTSGSRASALSYFVFTLTYLLLNKNYKILLLMLCTITISFLYVLSSDYLTIALAKSFRLFSGTTGRTIIWGASLDLIRDNLLLGVGPGGVSKMLYSYSQATHPIVGLALHDVIEKGMIHNGYLQWLAELGIPGLLLIIWADISFIRYVVNKIRSNITPYQKDLAIVVVSLFTAGLFHSIFESSMDIGPYSTAVGIFIIYITILKVMHMEHRESAS